MAYKGAGKFIESNLIANIVCVHISFSFCALPEYISQTLLKLTEIMWLCSSQQNMENEVLH